MITVDIHTHVLYGVDDGPESVEMSMEMLRRACDTGVRIVVATPHILDSFQNEDLILAHFRKLTQAVVAEKLPIDIYLGSEINFQFGMEDYFSTAIGTYRGMGRYFLVETTLTHYPKHFEETLEKIVPGGRIPIFAHPERVGPIVGDVDLIARLTDLGVLMQVNSGSLLGMFGGRVNTFAWELVDRDLVHFIASDAHDNRRRAFNLDEVWEELCGRKGEDTAERLMFRNPLNMLFGEPVD